MQSPTIHDEPLPSPETCCICGDIDDIIVDEDNHNGGGGRRTGVGVAGGGMENTIGNVGGGGIDGGGNSGVGGSMMMGGSTIPTTRSHHHHHNSGRIQFTTTKRRAASKVRKSKHHGWTSCPPLSFSVYSFPPSVDETAMEKYSMTQTMPSTVSLSHTRLSLSVCLSLSLSLSLSQNLRFYLFHDKKNLCSIIFQLYGSVWLSVFPYCVLNCSIMFLLEFLQEFYDIEFAFSLTGHQLMTLMISFLIISKVNLSYDRYMNARSSIGHALLLLRELNQSITMMATNNPKTHNNTTTNENTTRGNSSPQQEGSGGSGGSGGGGGGGSHVKSPNRSGAAGSQRKSAAASAAAAEDSLRQWRVEVSSIYMKWNAGTVAFALFCIVLSRHTKYYVSVFANNLTAHTPTFLLYLFVCYYSLSFLLQLFLMSRRIRRRRIRFWI